MRTRIRKWSITFLRLIVCAVALAWVLQNVTIHDFITLADGQRLRMLSEAQDGTYVVESQGQPIQVQLSNVVYESDGSPKIQYGLGSTWQRSDKTTLLLCLLIFAPVTLFQSLRFRLLLLAQRIGVTYWEALKLCYAGNFLNFITALGSTGGDVFKMYYVSLHTDQKTEAVTTVFLDRVVGLFGLVLVVCVLIAPRLDDPKIIVIGYGVLALLGGGLLMSAVLFSAKLRSILRVDAILSKMPFASHWRRAAAAARRLAENKMLLAGAVLSTVMLQLIALTSLVLAAKALHMRWDTEAIWDYYAYLACGVVISAVPISPQGLGTMEAYYKYALLGSHGSLAALLCLAMVVRGINLFWSLPGVLVTMTGAYRPRISEKDVQFA